MSNIPISSLPLAISLDGSEFVPLVQGGTTKRATVADISTFPAAGGSFVMATSSPSLTGSRLLSAQSGVTTVTDGGPLGNITVGIAANGIGNQQLRQSNALSVIGNATSALANVADIAGSAGQILRVNTAGTALGFGAIDLSQSTSVGANTISLSGPLTTLGIFPATFNFSGSTNVTFPTSGTLATTSGPALPAVVQGDLLYGSATNVLSTLAKNTAATRYLGNTGTSNNPAWVQIDLTNGVTGTLPATSGGTAQSTYTTGDTLYASAANTLSKLSGNITTAKQYLSQTGSGAASAAPVWATIAGADITGAALTKTDDTNVTLTLGGTPATALLRAASLTLGWTGQLSVGRGGTGLAAGTSGGVLGFTGATTLASSVLLTQNALILGGGVGATPTPLGSLGTTTTVLHGNAAGAPTFGAVSLTADVSGILPLANGGTNANLTASNGGIFYSTATAGAVLAGTATAGQILRSGAAAAPSWSTATWPATTTINQILYSSAANVVGGLATANGGILNTSSGGVPSITPTPILGVNGGTGGQITLNGATSGASVIKVAAAAGTSNFQLPVGNGSSGNFLQTDGAGNTSWTPAGGTGTVTSVGTSGILTGGPITASGTLNVSASFTPQGRLTLTSGVPVLVATVTGATTVFFTPYQGSLVPIYDGTNDVPTVFSEVSQSTTDTTKSPAAVAASSVYDVFAWNDGGTLRATRGPAWTNITTRSAGTALVRVNGILRNSVSITNGPAASRGTYVGTIYSNASATIDYNLGGVGAGGVAGVLGVWNMYNRRLGYAMTGDNSSGYAYTTNVYRQANASAGMQITFLRGINEDAINATYSGANVGAAGAGQGFGIGLDSTTVAVGVMGQSSQNTSGITASASFYQGLPSEGVHTVVALEKGGSSGTFYGNTNGYQTGMYLNLLL